MVLQQQIEIHRVVIGRSGDDLDKAIVDVLLKSLVQLGCDVSNIVDVGLGKVKESGRVRVN